jgi:glycosyltransferase involved in cell wall biosynthesis
VTAAAGRIALVTAGDADPESTTPDDQRALRERGWDAALITPTSCRRRGARVGAGLALAGAARRDPRTTWRALRGSAEPERAWCRRELTGRLVTLRPDVVHFDSARLAGAWLGVADALGRPLVVGVTAEDLYGAGDAPFESCAEVWARAAAVHLPDPALERRALQRGCPPDVPRAVVPLPVDTQLFAPGETTTRTAGADGADGPLRIVSAGRLEWMQGLEHAIHAVRLLRDAGVACEYTIVGDGDHLPALTFARHQLGVDDMVEFDGVLPARELRDRLARADVFLAAAVVDGLALPTLQALACGTPVVMTDAGPLGESAIDDRAAVVVPRRDPGALAEALSVLARDDSQRRDMGRAAREWAVEHTSADRRVGALDALLRRAS